MIKKEEVLIKEGHVKQIYGIKDLVANEFKCMIIANNDREAIRKAVITFGGDTPFRDLEVYHIAIADNESGLLYADTELRLISWEEYSLPMDMSEAIKPLGNPNKEVLEEK